MNLFSSNKGTSRTRGGRYLPNSYSKLKVKTSPEPRGSFSVPGCAPTLSGSFSSLPSSSGAHLIPFPSLLGLRLSGATQGPTLPPHPWVGQPHHRTQERPGLLRDALTPKEHTQHIPGLILYSLCRIWISHLLGGSPEM